MKDKTTILRIVFWFGMIADAFEAVRMAIPKLFMISTGTNLSYNAELTQGLLYGVPVMLGWTMILFWADRKPLERKGIILCLIPVILGYMVVQSIGAASGAYPIVKVIPTYIVQTLLLSLSIYGYITTRRATSSKKQE